MTRHPSEKEIWTAANQMIQRHGEDAERQARLLAKQMKVAGDLAGHNSWLRIVAAIELLQNTDAAGAVN